MMEIYIKPRKKLFLNLLLIIKDVFQMAQHGLKISEKSITINIILVPSMIVMAAQQPYYMIPRPTVSLLPLHWKVNYILIPCILCSLIKAKYFMLSGLVQMIIYMKKPLI